MWAPGWGIQRTLGYNKQLDVKLCGMNYSEEPLASDPCKSQWHRAESKTSKQLKHKVVSYWVYTDMRPSQAIGAVDDAKKV